MIGIIDNPTDILIKVVLKVNFQYCRELTNILQVLSITYQCYQPTLFSHSWWCYLYLGSFNGSSLRHWHWWLEILLTWRSVTFLAQFQRVAGLSRCHWWCHCHRCTSNGLYQWCYVGKSPIYGGSTSSMTRCYFGFYLCCLTRNWVNQALFDLGLGSTNFNLHKDVLVRFWLI